MSTEVELERRWVFRVDADSARLILAALGGRLRAERGEVLAAKQLGDLLTRQRSVQAKALADEMAKHVKAMESESSNEKE
jgi:hypothetical protein